jgi:hypothetical protein
MFIIHARGAVNEPNGSSHNDTPEFVERDASLGAPFFKVKARAG